jgi:hypothetical protein
VNKMKQKVTDHVHDCLCSGCWRNILYEGLKKR